MRCLTAVLAGSLLLGAPLRAQQDTTLLANGTSVGGTGGILLGEGAPLVTVSLEALALRAHATGGAFSLAFISSGLFECDVGAAFWTLGIGLASLPRATR